MPTLKVAFAISALFWPVGARAPPVVPRIGAVASGLYRNVFVEAGYAAADVDARVNGQFSSSSSETHLMSR